MNILDWICHVSYFSSGNFPPTLNIFFYPACSCSCQPGWCDVAVIKTERRIKANIFLGFFAAMSCPLSLTAISLDLGSQRTDLFLTHRSLWSPRCSRPPPAHRLLSPVHAPLVLPLHYVPQPRWERAGRKKHPHLPTKRRRSCFSCRFVWSLTVWRWEISHSPK